MERRLAAILAADVVCDSRPTGADEARRRGRNGIALVAVLWVLVLLSVIAAAFLNETRTETKLARNLVDNAQARALADAGVYRAVLSLPGIREKPEFGAKTEALLEDRAGIREALLNRPEIQEALRERAGLQAAELQSAVDEDVWRADGTVYVWPFAGGTVLISIQDEAGKIDLNRAPDELLEGLFVSVGVDEREARALIDAISDFRDPNELKRLNGAEDRDYRAAGLAYGAKDAPFEVVEELHQVLGMTPELYAQVAPALTVHARRRRVNRATAPPLVLRALPGLDAAGVEALIAAREEAGGGAAASLRRARVVTIRAEARTDSGAVYVREAVVRLTRGRAQPFRIEAWRQGQVGLGPTPEAPLTLR